MRPIPSTFACLSLVLLLAVSALACGDDTQLIEFDADTESRDERVIGGEVAPLGAFASTVRLVVLTVEGELQWCGGTLIAPTWVLTAAHCVLDGNLKLENSAAFRVVVGPGNEDVKSGVRLKIIDMIPHEKYTGSSHDIALIELEKAASAPSIQSFDNRTDSDLLTPGAPTLVAGWGRTSGVIGEDETSEKLRFTSLPFVPDAACREAIISISIFALLIFDDATMLCAGGELDKSSCNADSGGPLMVRRTQDTPWILVGVVNFGFTKTCGVKDVPVVYAEVAGLQDFIQGHLKKEGQSSPSSPINVSEKVMANRLELRWDDSAKNETHLIIAASAVGSEKWQYFKVPENATSKKFKTNVPGSYWFAIQSCNNSGCSAWTKTIRATTTR